MLGQGPAWAGRANWPSDRFRARQARSLRLLLAAKLITMEEELSNAKAAAC